MGGFNLPPGCSVADIERAMGGDGPCLVCLEHVDECSCVECPVCGAYGDERCYSPGHDLTGYSVERLDEITAACPPFRTRYDGSRFFLVQTHEELAGRRGRETLMAIEDMLVCQAEEMEADYYAAFERGASFAIDDEDRADPEEWIGERPS